VATMENFCESCYVIQSPLQPQPQPHLQIGESVNFALEGGSAAYCRRSGFTEHDGVLNVHVLREVLVFSVSASG
jgi:hypothetical protein